MKKVVPFTKTILFKTHIAEITEIEVNEDLILDENNEVKGDILVDGKYKTTEASMLEEEFHYELPFVIAIDDKYIADNIEIEIQEFNYEIINEEELKVNINIALDNLEEKEEIREEEILIPVEIEEDIKEVEEEVETLEKEDTNINSIFTNLTNDNETYSTYHVYIVKESDTLEYILDKYKINKEELSNYNDISSINIGDKLIIPCSND